MAALNWPFQIVLQQGVQPGMKIVVPPQARPAEEESVVPRVIQVGTIGEFLGSVGPQKLTQGPQEESAQCWEAQWQEVLKAVQPLNSGQETPLQSRTLAWVDTNTSPETISDINQWPKRDGCTRLPVEGNGGSLQALSNPDSVENRTGKEDRMRKETLDAEIQRQHFRQLKYRETEGPRKVCRRLQEFCRQWLRPESHTKEQILELVVLEQFLAILPLEIQSWLRGCCPQACSHAVVLAEDFLKGQQQETKRTAPCEDVVMISSDSEWSPQGSGPEYFCGGAQPASDLSGKDRCLNVYPVSPGEKTLNGNNSGPSQQGGSEPLAPFGVLSGQSGLLEGHSRPQQEHATAPPPTWEEITRCSEGMYETVVHLEEHKHWCLECGESFPDASQLVRHQKMHPQAKRPECPKCGKSFRDLSHVIRHQTVHTGEKPYGCFVCGQSFTQKPALIRHQQKHQEGQPYTGFESNTPHQRPLFNCKRPQCPECGKSFRDISHVLRHQTVHTGEKPYRCPECGQGFTQKPALNRHQQKHLESQPYTAGNEGLGVYQDSRSFNPLESAQRSPGTSQENVSSTFTNGCKVEYQPLEKQGDPVPSTGGNRPLKKYQNRRGQKNYWCVTCGKGFRDKADVVRHQRIHTGEKPYLCVDCGKRFSTTSSLYKHQIIHQPPILKEAT